MGKRGPQPQKFVVIGKNEIQRPSPVVGMTDKARTVWKRIVGSFPPDHFKPHTFDLLRIYCEAAVTAKYADAQFAKSGYKDQNWLRIADKAASRCQGLSVKLGVSVNSTVASRGKPGEAKKKESKRAGLMYGAKN